MLLSSPFCHKESETSPGSLSSCRDLTPDTPGFKAGALSCYRHGSFLSVYLQVLIMQEKKHIIFPLGVSSVVLRPCWRFRKIVRQIITAPELLYVQVDSAGPTFAVVAEVRAPTEHFCTCRTAVAGRGPAPGQRSETLSRSHFSDADDCSGLRLPLVPKTLPPRLTLSNSDCRERS